MAFAETFVSVLSTLWTVFIWSWWLILIITLFIVKRRWSKFPIDAVIIEQRGDNLIRTNDRLGRWYDKFGDIHSYKLQKTKETIPVFNFDWILYSAAVPTNFLERIINFLRPTIGTAFLYRYGSKQYKPININNKKTNKLQLKEVKSKDGSKLYTYQYGQFDPRWVLGNLDFEVVDWDNINFMVQEQRASVLRRQKKGELWKTIAIPAMIIAGAVIVSIIMMKYSVDVGRDLRGGAGQPTVEGGGSKLLGGVQDVVTPGA